MTELARILTECKDTVFTVCFKKKVTIEELEASLGTVDITKPELMK